MSRKQAKRVSFYYWERYWRRLDATLRDAITFPTPSIDWGVVVDASPPECWAGNSDVEPQPISEPVLVVNEAAPIWPEVWDKLLTLVID